MPEGDRLAEWREPAWCLAEADSMPEGNRPVSFFASASALSPGVFLELCCFEGAVVVVRVGVVQIIVLVGGTDNALRSCRFARFRGAGAACAETALRYVGFGICLCSALALHMLFRLGKGCEGGAQGVAFGAGFAIIGCHGIISLQAFAEIRCVSFCRNGRRGALTFMGNYTIASCCARCMPIRKGDL